MDKIKILSIFGTRPEATKMAPLVKALGQCKNVHSAVCVTAQHRQQLDQVLDVFNITPDYDLNIMIENQDLAHITTSALNGLMKVIKDSSPHLILAHGDTSTTMAASLAAYYSQVKLGHVEAGLRTYNKFAPFPEEINRKIVSCVADLSFAPTEEAKSNLLKENITSDSIFVTGNTAIDAIDSLVKEKYHFKENILNGIDFANKRIIAVTAHRRENYGKPFENIFRAFVRLVKDFDNAEIVYPVHLSPSVRNIAYKILGNSSKIHLTEPVDIEDWLNIVSRSYLVMTDSGGIQEEAPHLNKPALVLRNVTERPEGLAAGCLALAGTDENAVYNIAAKLLTDTPEYQKMSAARNPFGDGKASERIINAILYHFGLLDKRPEDFKL